MPLRETKLIEKIRRQTRRSRALPVGIGDDCAVLRVPTGHELLVTTDFTLENVHFRRNWHRPEVVGWRCLTRGLSDIAAMGGTPLAAFLSLAVDSGTPQRWVDRFLKGLLALANRHHVPLAGGDTAQSASGIQADIAVVGSVPTGQAVLRSGARPGDGIYVTGELGGSATALSRLRRSEPVSEKDYVRHFRPEPRLAVGDGLRRRQIVSAMIDLSDGLSTDLRHICEESRVGAVLDEEAIPRAKFGRPAKPVDVDMALHGGEDYELLFTSAGRIPPKIAGVPVTRIGSVVSASGVRLVDARGKSRILKAAGWEHFSR